MDVLSCSINLRVETTVASQFSIYSVNFLLSLAKDILDEEFPVADFAAFTAGQIFALWVNPCLVPALLTVCKRAELAIFGILV